MFAGAALGAVLVLKSGVPAALGVTLLLDLLAVIWAVRLSLLPEEIAPAAAPVSTSNAVRPSR
jgi:hypothetical protein